MKKEIYDYLNKIDCLNSKNYSYLINIYNKSDVDSVIEEMIEVDSINLKKFNYYVKNIMGSCDLGINSAFDAYIADLSGLETYTKNDNIRAIREISNIISKIDGIISKYMEIDDSKWVSDRVDKLIESSPSGEDLIEVKKLYKLFCDKRNEIVNGNLRFVIYVAKKYSRLSKDFEELVQYGNEGLMKAVEKYDTSYSNNFTTYAYYWIMQSITRNGSMDNAPLSISHRIINLNVAIRRAEKDLTMLYNRKPTNEEIASYLNISVDNIRDVNSAFCGFVSLNEELPTGESGDTYVDFISDDNVNIEKEIIDNQMAEEVRMFLKDNLTEREYEVICYRFGIENHEFKVLEEIGEMYGLTRERIRQIEMKSLRKLRIRGKSLKTYIER